MRRVDVHVDKAEYFRQKREEKLMSKQRKLLRTIYDAGLENHDDVESESGNDNG